MKPTVLITLAAILMLPWLALAADEHDAARRKQSSLLKPGWPWSIKASTAKPGIRRPST